MTENWYDVIIIGAGPAGSTCAYHLAKENLNVLILDKDKFPRQKICAAGLTFKAKNLLPFDLSEVIENEIKTVIFSHKLQDNFSKTYNEPLMYCTNRFDFDLFLLNKAREAGTKCIEGSIVTEIDDHNDFVLVTSPTGSYKARYVVGADGAKGITAKKSGIKIIYEESIGLEADIKLDDSGFLKYPDSVFFDYATIPCGYAWVFPKKNHLSIGVGSYKFHAKYLNTYFKLIINKFGPTIKNQYQLKAFPLTHIIPGSSVIGKSVLLVGDAAGLVEPFTGEGIHYAIKSGQIASEKLYELLTNRTDDGLINYQKAIESEIIKELNEAKRLMFIFNTMTGYIHQKMKDKELYFRAVSKILRGERRFSDVQKRLGITGIFWKTGSKICQNIINKKLTKFVLNEEDYI